MSNRYLVTILIFTGFLFFACEDAHKNHPVFNYYPSEDVFEEGYVNKYYYHYYPDNPDATAVTEIRYAKYLKTGENTFKTELYNAGFEWTGDRYYRLTGDTLWIEKGTGVSRDRKDTLDLDLINNISSVWEGSIDLPYQIKYKQNNKEYLYTEFQRAVYDSIILDQPARVFYNEWNYREVGSDSVFNSGTSRSYYIQGLGFYGTDEKGNNYATQTELVEQMPASKFNVLRKHNKHRIAYIDPEKSMSDDSGFKLCREEEFINDYYNGWPNAQYIDGKREMERIIFGQLEPQKLTGQTGMLTFRFVVNCEGKAGRFVTEQFDFDYRRKEFSREAVDHLLGILLNLEKWQPVVIHEENRDAYVYITFKIDNGEITEILP